MLSNEESNRPVETYMMIGNGFDLEAGLPTRYADFLSFLTAIQDYSYTDEDNESFKVLHQSIKEQLKQQNPKDLNKEWKRVIDNFWYDHFLTMINNFINWIDFESEVSRIVRYIEYTMDYLRDRRLTLEDRVIVTKADIPDALEEVLHIYGEIPVLETNGTELVGYDITYRELRDRLLDEFNAFVGGFERYLQEYVEKIKVQESQSILYLMKLLIDNERSHIISFNYTTTIERHLKILKTNTDICYIHGRIGNEQGVRNNIVLGMDEYLPTEEIKDHIGFASFRKYNQRIVKATNTSYMDWLKQIEANPSEKRLLIIFGHSVGTTDGDIIRAFIRQKGMQTIIFYHDEDTLNTAVANLSAILDKDELVSRTGGKDHSMEFRHQQTMDPESIQWHVN